MESNSLPLVRASSIIRRHRTSFHTLNGRLILEAPQDLVRDLVNLCDGTKRYEQIMEEIGVKWERESVERLVGSLFDQGVIVDARSLDRDIWKAVENPMRFPMAAPEEKISQLVREAKERHRSDDQYCVYESQESPLKRLLECRRSERNFSGESVDFQSLINMLWSAYGEFEGPDGVFRRTSPSAGALYPLMLHIALFKETGNLHPAVYKVCYDNHGRVGFKSLSEDIDRVARAYLNPGVLAEACGVIVVSGSFTFPGEKYGNRGLLYVPLEAGHVAQNILVSAVECGVATLELGGFADALLAEALELPKEYKPLTTIAFGREGGQVGKFDKNLQISWAVPMSGRYRPSFSIASAKVIEKRSWSNGRDSSPKLALIKAVAEAKEWAACGSIPDLVSAPYTRLESAVDPRSIIRFHPAHYRTKGFPFSPFDENAEYAWASGRDYETGEQVRILADHVYFPYFPKTPYYCFANSSGCSAHSDEQTAIETAVLELIERDSFMIAYLGRLSCPTVNEETLPSDIRKRISDLREIGFEVWIKDHSLDLAPVAMVFVQNQGLSYTKCASCASFSLVHAVAHALSEVEASVLSRLQNGQPTAIKPHDVGSPLEHGRLYASKHYFRAADFLVRGKESVSFQEMGSRASRSWQELMERFTKNNLRLLTIPLYLSDEYGGSGNLHIVRAIIPGLIPMTFGNRQEPAGMERIYRIGKEFGGKELSYGELTKLPHPFE